MRTLLSKILILLFSPLALWSQVDTVVLEADQLLFDDIAPAKTEVATQKIFATTRSLKDLKDLPFTIHVITKEEIRDNGYRTLVDALKMSPGIRVSQPGSAIEGETFLMRGLLGNGYTKILLNGNPIKPSVVKGMPIGAQLPIQQAERIEVIYGAMGSLYGGDGSAGIVNIVLEETERPVYTQANLSLGSNEFTNLDVSFGGRLGKRKNTLRYSLFGNFTFRNDWKITHQNDTLLDVNNYNGSRLDYGDIQNFVTRFDDALVINNFPHQSRLVGLNLNYRAMQLSIEVMYRRDHSSLGLSPAAVSYTNPLNYTGERIINGNFSVNKNYRKFGFEWRLSYLGYIMDSRSSNNYILNSVGTLLDDLTWEESRLADNTIDLVKYDSLTNNNFDTYFNGTRFIFSESIDVRSDIIFNIYPNKNLDFKIGFIPKLNVGSPLLNYSRVPLGSNLFDDNEVPERDDLTPIRRVAMESYEFYAFAQLFWKFKNWTTVAGVQWFINREFLFGQDIIDSDDVRESIDPRIGINYKINKSWSARAFYGTAFRVPSTYYKANSFNISYDNIDLIEFAVSNLSPEKTKTYEVGIRRTQGKSSFWGFSGFYNITSNLITYDTREVFDAFGRPQFYSPGFYNSETFETKLFGLQFNYFFKSEYTDFGFNWVLTYDDSSEPLSLNIAESNRLSEQPRSIRKTRIVIKPNKRIAVTFDTVFNSSAVNRINGRSELPKFRTFDMLTNYNINRNFRVFFKLKNILNKEYAGLNATNTLDDLFYNPQEKRTFRVGMSYQID